MHSALTKRMRTIRPLDLIVLLAGFTATLLLRRNAAAVAGAVGAVATVYLVSAAGAAVYTLRPGNRPGALIDGAKVVAGIHCIAIAVLAPLWAHTPGEFAPRLTALSLPLLIYGAWQAFRLASLGEGDLLKRIVAVFVPRRMAPLLTAELRIIGLSIFAWAPHRCPAGQRSFSSAAMLGPVLLAVAALSSVEVLVMHIVIRHWSPTGASTVAALGIFTAVYIVGLAKSLKYMPSLMTSDALIVRLGHFLSVEIPYEEIQGIGPSAGGAGAPAGTLNLAPLTSPNLIIRLAREREVVGPTGRKRRFRELALRLDDPRDFEASLRAHLGQQTRPERLDPGRKASLPA